MVRVAYAAIKKGESIGFHSFFYGAFFYGAFYGLAKRFEPYPLVLLQPLRNSSVFPAKLCYYSAPHFLTGIGFSLVAKEKR